MIAWIVWFALAGAAPSDALPPLARDMYERAQQHERDEAWSKAAAAYRLTWSQEPDWTQALVDESRMRVKAGDLPGALAALRRAPSDPDTLEQEARLLLADDQRPDAAKVVRRLMPLRPEWPEVHLLLADALSTSDPVGAAGALRRYLDVADPLEEDTLVRVTLGVARNLALGGLDRDASDLVDRVLQQVPGPEAIDAFAVLVHEQAELRREDEVSAHAADLAHAAAVPLSPGAVGQVRRARTELFNGQPALAVEILLGVVHAEPNAVVAWTTLSLAYQSAGDVDGAVAAASMAEKLDPLDAETSARLGDLLASNYGDRLHIQALRAYTRAVQRRGADPGLWLRKARSEARAGRVTASLESYRRVVRLAPESAEARLAGAELEDLLRPVPSEAVVVSHPMGRPSWVPADAWTALHRAWAWQRRGSDEEDALERAAAEVAKARKLAPTWTRAVNLDAAIRLDRGDDAGALAEYRHSLDLDDEQGPVWRMVAVLLRQNGDLEGANQAMDLAAALGEPTAVLARAERLSGDWRLWGARTELDRYREISVDEAARVDSLSSSIERRMLGLYAGGIALGLAMVAAPLWIRRRRRAGVGLDTVLQRAPRAYPDVARVLASIRHEVIKHHTTTLASVADAIEDGDDEPARWAMARLFGPNGAVPTFWSYLRELDEIGARAGVRLNLLHRDLEMAVLVRAMTELSGLEHNLHLQKPSVLRALDDRLNDESYRMLGRRLAALCQLQVDESLLREAFASAAREQSAAVSLVLDLPAEPLVVRMYRQDLHDVLVNLLRNSIEVAVAAGAERVGIAVRIDEDWITGLQRVELRVRDDSPAPLTTAKIRGRFIGRGLGLAVDLVTRAAGAIHVEPEPGWSKAVVVRLPHVEEEG